MVKLVSRLLRILTATCARIWPIDHPFGGLSLNYALLIVYALVAIGTSFLCSIAEAVVLSVTPSHIASLRGKSPRQAKLLQKLKDNIDRPLAAILSINTIAHTVGATGVGAEAVAIWGDHIVGIASAVMTLLILVLSEIIPKTIGAVYWRFSSAVNRSGIIACNYIAIAVALASRIRNTNV